MSYDCACGCGRYASTGVEYVVVRGRGGLRLDCLNAAGGFHGTYVPPPFERRRTWAAACLAFAEQKVVDAIEDAESMENEGVARAWAWVGMFELPRWIDVLDAMRAVLAEPPRAEQMALFALEAA